MFNIFWNLTAFIVTLGILVIVHEFGHFWIARNCMVHVERFSIGFGKILWKYIDRYGTEFTLSLIPLGGYVKILEDSEKSTSIKMRKYAFNNKTIGKRIAIIIAGSLSNLIFSILIYWVIFIIGIPVFRPIIGGIVPNSIAENSKIFPGMEIKAINGIETIDWNSVRFQLMSEINNKKIIFSILNPNSRKEENIALNLNSSNLKLKEKEDIIYSLGILPCSPEIEPVISKIQKNSSASKSGLHIGDRIISINDQPLTKWNTFSELVRNNPGKPLKIDIKRKGSHLSLILTPDSKVDGENVRGFVGVIPKISPLPEEHKIIFQYNPFDAIIKSISKTFQLVKITTQIIGKLIIGSLNLGNLSGPISIAQRAKNSAESGIIYYFMFLALTSVNLGIINLFPLPILDGGHLLFLIIEKIKGKPVSNRVQNFSYRIGSIVLVLLMGLAFFNDFSRL